MPLEHHSHGSLPYLFSPSSVNTDKGAPLVLFLHGGRDRGTDLNTLLKWGLPRFVNESDSLPYAFAAPQILEEQTWVDRAADVIALLNELLATQSIDPARVIIAGFSLGSAGSWHLATTYPDRFAGLVAVSGRIPNTSEASQLAVLRDIPIQIFQGGQDEKLSVEDTEQFVITLKKLGVNVNFTLILEGDHFIADAVYESADLQDWFGTVSPRATAISV
jgi:predicted peptidase